MKKKLLALLLSAAMAVTLLVPAVLPVSAEDSIPQPPAQEEVLPEPAPEAEPAPEVEPAPESEPAPEVEPAPESEPAELLGQELFENLMQLETAEELAQAMQDLSDLQKGSLSEQQLDQLDLRAQQLARPEPAPEAEPDLFGRLMAVEEDAAFEQAVLALTEEEAAQLTPEQVQALVDRLDRIQAAKPAPQTVPVLDPGPFMAPVYVGGLRMRMFSAAPESPLHMQKSAQIDENGTVTITMEAYTTGMVIDQTKSVPTDVVLVLDQSGSMDYDLGKSGITRQKAMKDSIGKFIGNVNKKYSAQADHRIALVEFRSDAKVIQGWTAVNDKGAKTLKNKVNSLRADGATNVGAGMQKAETLLGSGYNYSGPNTTRNKVVVVFTDGVPTTSNEFHTGVANTAIQSAKRMKDSGVTVYTVGIFQGADPSKTYGDEEGLHQKSDGTVGSEWKAKQGFISGGDLDLADIGAANRFMNYVSSNYGGAEEIGLKKQQESGVFVSYYGWKITKNFERTSPAGQDYYLSADNQKSLDEIFQNISEQIATPGISLGSDAFVQDTISPYFTVPNVEDVKVYTADYNGSGFEESTLSTLEATVNESTIRVQGFDFDKNFVSNNPKSDGSFGKKLIIQVQVQPKPGFLGGNGVPTNTSDSGLYKQDGDPVGAFTVPTVDVPVQGVSITAPSAYAYLNSQVTPSNVGVKGQLTDWNSNPVEISNFDDPTQGLKSWQYDFVEVEASLTGLPVQKLQEDVEYTATLSVTPKKQQGTALAQRAQETGTVTVLIPTITWKDSQIDLGQTANFLGEPGTGVDHNFVSAEWAEAPEGAAVIGKAPALHYEFDRSEKGITQDTPVKVTVMIGADNVTEFVQFKHQECPFPGCQWGQEGFQGCQFIVHIKSFDLTITKNAPQGCTDSFLFRITGDNGYSNTVVIQGSGTVTLKNMPGGIYTVQEDTSWSWNYTCQSEPQTVTPQQTAAEFTNASKGSNLLHSEVSVDNQWVTVPGKI